MLSTRYAGFNSAQFSRDADGATMFSGSSGASKQLDKMSLLCNIFLCSGRDSRDLCKVDIF